VLEQCPKCAFRLDKGSLECPGCGIVISRYLARHGGGEAVGVTSPVPCGNGAAPRSSATSQVQPGAVSSAVFALSGRLFAPVPKNCTPLITAGQALLTLILLIISFQLWAAPVESNRAGESFLHLVNLPFHEAGHIIFMPFGEFTASLGGTLGQLLVPLLCMGAFLFHRFDNFGAAVCFWWFGENFLDIAPYINDARSGTLPLIGGNTGQSAPYGFHDWEYLLTETGLLGYDQEIARASAFAGTLIMAMALLWAGTLAWRQFRVLWLQQ